MDQELKEIFRNSSTSYYYSSLFFPKEVKKTFLDSTPMSELRTISLMISHRNPRSLKTSVEKPSTTGIAVNQEIK